MKSRNNEALATARSIMHQIAERENVTYQHVYSEIENVIHYGMASTDPVSRKHWAAIKFYSKKSIPTPEDVILYSSTHINSKLKRNGSIIFSQK